MITPFTFQNYDTIEFGAGKIKEIMTSIEKEHATKAMVVVDGGLRKLGLYKKVTDILEANSFPYLLFSDFTPNPSVLSVDACAKQIREEGCDIIIAIGGGSSMDVGKGAAVVATNEGSIMDYMYLRHDKARKVVNPLLPLIAVPTTSGTGSEVSECIVLIDTDQIKDVFYDSVLLPKYAYVDPEMTYGMPKSVCANTGLDVLGHALEAYVSTLENEMADLFAKEAIRLTFAYLPASVQGDEEARNYMALASMYAGIAQSKNGCVIPHAVSCPLSALKKVPHGLGVGVAQIPNIEYTSKVSAKKYKAVIDYIDPHGSEIPEEKAAEALIEKIHGLFKAVGVDEKVDIGPVDEAFIQRMAKEALLEIDIEGSPRQPVTEEDLIGIYHEILKLD
jgi:alcohol dehydrogenase class IV